jgi:putative hydrolase of the HAD superfamily
LGIKPEETLFLDDSQKNLDAAAELGFQTLLVTPGSEFFELLNAR